MGAEQPQGATRKLEKLARDRFGETLTTSELKLMRAAPDAPPHYTRFAPLVYSVENSLPLVKLGQEDNWHPQPNSASASSTGKNWPTSLPTPSTWTHSQLLQRRLILWGLQRDSDPKGKLSWLQRILVYYGLQPHPDREAERSRPSRWFTSPRFVRWFLWIHILLGWLLATLFLAGVTGIVRKD